MRQAVVPVFTVFTVLQTSVDEKDGLECLEGAFLESAFTLDQVEKTIVVEAVELGKAQCVFLSGSGAGDF